MPAQFSVRVTDKGVYNGLRKVGEGLPHRSQAEILEFMERAQYQASGGYSGGYNYALVPSRGYQRTGNYGRSFTLERTGLTYTLRNATYSPAGKEYGVYVGGNAAGDGQAWMHVGYWPVIAVTIALLVETDLVPTMNADLAEFFRECGVGL